MARFRWARRRRTRRSSCGAVASRSFWTMPTPASSEATVFEMIARGEHDTKVLHETRGAIAFNDIAPYGAVHIIVAPRRPIVSCVTELKRSVEHRALVAELVTLGRKALQERCCDVGESEWVLGFEERTIFHAIPHICLHAIAPPNGRDVRAVGTEVACDYGTFSQPIF